MKQLQLRGWRAVAAALAIAALGVRVETATAQFCDVDAAITRMSVATDGTQGNGISYFSSISGDGTYISYSSDASNLVVGDTNLLTDVYVRNRAACETARMSLATNGSEPNGNSSVSSISGTGGYIAFATQASNLLVTGDTNFVSDIYSRTRQSTQIQRISVNAASIEANNRSLTPDFSDDGNWIAFESTANNLVSSDTNMVGDIFIRPRLSLAVERVSVATGGAQANGFSAEPAVSQTGRYVVFLSQAANLVPNDSNLGADVFVRDRQLGTTTRISVASDGTQANANSYGAPDISDDGRYIVFTSAATNLAPNDNNAVGDVFLRDQVAGTTTRITNGTGGGASGVVSISGNGRWMVFESTAVNLVPNDSNGANDIFVYDRDTREIRRVSVAADGTQGNASSQLPAISRDGRFISFESYATNLVTGDTNNVGDVFVVNRVLITGGNLLANPGFDNGLAAWKLFAIPDSGITHNSAIGGVFAYQRNTGASQSVIFQDTGVAFPDNTPFDIQLDLGNSSHVRKRVAVLVHDQLFIDTAICAFWIPPNSSLRQYRMTMRNTRSWPNGASISIYATPPDSIPSILIDNVRLAENLGPGSSRTFCYSPDAPSIGVGATGPEILQNGDFSNGATNWNTFGQIAPGSSVVNGVYQTYRTTGDPAGAVLQTTSTVIPANTPFELRFQIGSTIAQRTRFVVLIHNNNFRDSHACNFWMPASAPLQTYVVRGHTMIEWAEGAAVSFYPSPGFAAQPAGWELLDNVSLKTRPSISVIGTECYPAGTTPADGGDELIAPLDNKIDPLGILSDDFLPTLIPTATSVPLDVTIEPPPVVEPTLLPTTTPIVEEALLPEGGG